MDKFLPGEHVLRSGVYRVYHDSHRLMPEVSLREGETFPSCKQCQVKVRFELVRILRGERVLPFREGPILKDYKEEAKAWSA